MEEERAPSLSTQRTETMRVSCTALSPRAAIGWVSSTENCTREPRDSAPLETPTLPISHSLVSKTIWICDDFMQIKSFEKSSATLNTLFPADAIIIPLFTLTLLSDTFTAWFIGRYSLVNSNHPLGRSKQMTSICSDGVEVYPLWSTPYWRRSSVRASKVGCEHVTAYTILSTSPLCMYNPCSLVEDFLSRPPLSLGRHINCSGLSIVTRASLKQLVSMQCVE